MFSRKSETTPQQLTANKLGLEAGWYLPPNPDPYTERTPADLAEEASLLNSEDFFGIVGAAMGQLPTAEGKDLGELAIEAQARAQAEPDSHD